LVVIDHEKDSIEMKNGYEKVLIARLLDAKFFFERFLNSDINEIFDKKLKQKESEFSELSIFDLNSKIFDLAEKIILKNNKNIKLERNMLDASRIDLCFELISEYPALRGIMSSYFWKNFDKSSFSSFFAIDENIVEEKRNQIYSISKNIYFNAGEVYKRDILDSDAFEARFFGICEKIIRLQYFFFEKNQNPTASKDPFALKRDLYNLFQFISQDSIDFENSKIKNSLFDFDIFDIIFDYEKKTNEQKDNLLNFIYKNLEQFIYSQIEFIEASIQKDFLRKIVNFVVSDLYQNQKILSFMNSEKLNILRIFEVILYLLKLKEEVNISFKDAFKRISQMYSKKYKNFQINLNEVEFAFDLNEEIELNEFCKKISNDLDNIEDSKDYIEKLLKYSDNIPSLINSFLDNVFIEDSDEGKKIRRIFLLTRIFEIIQKKFDFDKFFELF
jgi:glycyl-tRNA synthetase beta chain